MAVIIKRSSPDDFDWPATILLYTIIVLLGIGMCFCLRRANRLIPNRFSFPLVERAFSRQPARGFYDLGSEEEEAGLLNSYSDSDTEHNMEDAELIDNQNALQITSESTDEGARRSKSQASEEEEEEEFSELQSH